MKLNEVQRKTEERKIVRINLKTTPKDSKWMKENKVSPQLLFDKALEELKEKGEK